MPIVIHLDVILARRKIKSKELAAYIGISEQNLSLLKSARVKGIRCATLAKICERLDCQPGDLMAWEVGNEGDEVDEDGAGPES